MTTTRETILAAIFTLLPHPRGVKKFRNHVDAEDAGQDALTILFDGECTNIETILSPLQYFMEMRPVIEVIVQSSKEDYRRKLMDDLLVAIQTALLADRTLSGKCDWIDLQPPDISDEAIMALDHTAVASPVKTARITPIITYVTTSSIG